MTGFTDQDDENKENLHLTSSTVTTTPLSKKSSSVPVSMDDSGHHHEGSVSKKRKLFSQSLDETNCQPLYSNILTEHPIYSNLPPSYVTPPGPGANKKDPPPYKTPSPQPLYANMPSVTSHQPITEALYANLGTTVAASPKPSASMDDTLFKVRVDSYHF